MVRQKPPLVFLAILLPERIPGRKETLLPSLVQVSEVILGDCEVGQGLKRQGPQYPHEYRHKWKMLQNVKVVSIEVPWDHPYTAQFSQK